MDGVLLDAVLIVEEVIEHSVKVLVRIVLRQAEHNVTNSLAVLT